MGSSISYQISLYILSRKKKEIVPEGIRHSYVDEVCRPLPVLPGRTSSPYLSSVTALFLPIILF